MERLFLPTKIEARRELVRLWKEIYFLKSTRLYLDSKRRGQSMGLLHREQSHLRISCHPPTGRFYEKRFPLQFRYTIKDLLLKRH